MWTEQPLIVEGDTHNLPDVKDEEEAANLKTGGENKDTTVTDDACITVMFESIGQQASYSQIDRLLLKNIHTLRMLNIRPEYTCRNSIMCHFGTAFM